LKAIRHILKSLKISIIVIVSFLCSYLFISIVGILSQPIELRRNTYGGDDSEAISDIVKDSEGDLYFTGATWKPGNVSTDMILVKYNRYGDTTWRKTWGNNESDMGLILSLDSENNVYVVVIRTYYSIDKHESFLLKYDNNGNKIWEHQFTYFYYQFIKSMIIDESDNIYLCGDKTKYSYYADFNKREIFLYMFDISGNLLLNETWVQEPSVEFNSFHIDSENNVFILGEKASEDVIFVKLNKYGSLMWNRTWGGSNHEYARDFRIDSKGNSYTLVVSRSFTPYDAQYVLKYNNSGDLQWEFEWGSSWSYLNGIALDKNESIYLSGGFWDGEKRNPVFLKLNHTGFILWELVDMAYSNYNLDYSIYADFLYYDYSSKSFYALTEIYNHQTRVQICSLLQISEAGELQRRWEWNEGNYINIDHILFYGNDNIVLLGVTSKSLSDEFDFDILIIYIGFKNYTIEFFLLATSIGAFAIVVMSQKKRK
jgi:hypothetical protein